ncbi:hypothetical protein MIND_01232300 [Mycena indigotica]|uniref:Geranylgeranyl pyrophosphate synthetase n=1 Tax=Mycena indigotica TaxID=2126181 RepID=A0A8H6S596_9AGAR|nr:uncharacterized protein MIND_01232300 [Mycena indigotica]KAF7292062.1 hypothetical protein MIND_01232300 [Mycena indigotica]
MHPAEAQAEYRGRGRATWRGSRGQRPFRGLRGRGTAARGFRADPSAPRDAPPRAPPDKDLLDGLTPTPLRTVPRPALVGQAKPVVVTDMKVLGSYNWGKAPEPTIVVPGSPPQWRNRPLPYQVELDRGLAFVDENAFRAPNRYALLPLIAAVDKTCEIESLAGDKFDWAGEHADFLTTRNVLRRLLRWVDSPTDPGSEQFVDDFRIDTQLAGSTVLLNRWEKCDQQEMVWWSYGLNFEKATTTPASGITENTGHQRIISYDLDGLRMVVRFEVDAYLPENMKPKPKLEAEELTFANLAARLAGIDLATPKFQIPSHASPPSSRASASPEPFTCYHGLRVVEAGTPIPQRNLVDLSTRSERRMLDIDWSDFYIQHFLSQIDMHFVGVHERGLFSRVVKRSVLENDTGSEDLGAKIQPTLRKLRVALDTIRDSVLEHGQRGRLSLVCRQGELQVFERPSMASCLPQEILDRFIE